MFASICRRRLLRLRQIPSAAGINPSRPNPSDLLISHGCSSAALAGIPVSEPYPTTISYLISCGLSPAAASACKHHIRIRSTAKADAVRALLRSYAFTDADITEVVRKEPSILNLDPDILRPKLDLFASLRVKPQTLATAPTLLARSLDKHLLPCIQFLRGIIGADSDVGSAICHAPGALLIDLDKRMRPVVDALRRLGLPDKSISKLLAIRMSVLKHSVDRITQIFDDVKALGLDVTDTGFVYGISWFSRLSRETWLRKVALYRSFGFSEGDLQKGIKMRPQILCLSDENIKKKLRFFLDDLKLELSEVMERPVLITYSLEKTFIPRCAVISLLMRERKIDPNIKLSSALLDSAKRFSERYVLRHAQDVPDVVKAYQGKIAFEGFRDRNVLAPFKP